MMLDDETTIVALFEQPHRLAQTACFGGRMVLGNAPERALPAVSGLLAPVQTWDLGLQFDGGSLAGFVGSMSPAERAILELAADADRRFGDDVEAELALIDAGQTL